MDEEAGVDGGGLLEVADGFELFLGFFDDVGAVFDVLRILDSFREELAGFCRVEIGDEAVGFAVEGIDHGLIILGVAGGKMTAGGGGGENFGKGGEVFGVEFFDNEAGFFSG